MSVFDDIEEAQERELGPLRREAGMPECEDESPTAEEMWRYIELLESSVVAKATALKWAAEMHRAERDAVSRVLSGP